MKASNGSRKTKMDIANLEWKFVIGLSTCVLLVLLAFGTTDSTSLIKNFCQIQNMFIPSGITLNCPSWPTPPKNACESGWGGASRTNWIALLVQAQWTPSRQWSQRYLWQLLWSLHSHRGQAKGTHGPRNYHQQWAAINMATRNSLTMKNLIIIIFFKILNLRLSQFLAYIQLKF